MPGYLRRVALASALLAAACAAPGDPGEGPGSLAGTEWQLRELAAGPVAGDPWIAFEADGEAGGNSGCNSFGGSYDQDGARLTFSDIASTMMACVDPGRMETEAAFMAALMATRRADATDGLLRLMEDDGTVLATLERRAGG